jgi:hypothetical protein
MNLGAAKAAGLGIGILGLVCGSAVALPPAGVGQGGEAGVAPVSRPERRSVFFDRPTKDTSTYSNIGASGNTRQFVWMSTFPGEGRQSCLVTMYNTGLRGVPTGADARRVLVQRMVFTVCTFPSGPRALYDATPDPWQNNLWAGGEIAVYDAFINGSVQVGSVFVSAEPRYVSLGPSEDGNKPVELFGARFNNGWTAASWVESGVGTPAFQNGMYNIEPIDFDEAGNRRDVLFSMGETAVEFVLGMFQGDDGFWYDTYYPTGNFLPDPVDGFDPRPFGIGKSYDIPDGTPGHSIGGVGQQTISLNQQIPPGHRLKIVVDVDDPWVQRYLRESFEAGWLTFVVSQLALADLGFNGSYSYWLTKEGSNSLPGAFDLDPSTLEFDYIYAPPGDFNGDGVVDPSDRGPALLAITDPEAYKRAYPLLDPSVMTDMNGDALTDLGDLVAIIELLSSY